MGGRLTIDAPEGDFPSTRPWVDVPLIHGQTANGKALTLRNSAQVRAKHHFPGTTEATFSPHHTLVGAWFEESDLAFGRLAARLSSLDEWVGVSGFEVQREEGGYQIAYSPPASVALGELDDARFVVHFSGPGVVYTNPLLSLNLSQQARFDIHTEDPLPLDRLLRYVHQMRNYLSFVARQPALVLEVVALADVEVRRSRGVETRAEPISILYKSDLDVPRGEQLARRKMLFRPEDLGPDRLPFQTWLEKGEVLGPVIDLYLVSLYQPSIYLELQFVSLAQGLESLHSRKFPNYDLAPADHKARVSEILAVTPDVHREWLGRQLANSNKASFRQGLIDLIATLPSSLQQRVADVKAFSKLVHTTRNYLIHWNPDLERKAAHGEALVRLTQALQLILESLLLLELEFTPEEIERLVTDNWTIKRDLDFAFER